MLSEPQQAVLDDDHRAVDDQPEVERTQTHQVGAHAPFHHRSNGQQHRQRNDHGGDQRRSQVAEHRHQHTDHQQCADTQVLLNGRDGLVYQRAAVVDRVGAHARRQRFLNFFELPAGSLGHRAAVLADQHEDRPQHDLLAVLCRRTRAQIRTELDVRDLLERDRHVIALSNHDRFDVGDACDLTRRADQILLAGLFDVAGTDVGVVARERLHHVVQRQVIR